MNPRFIGYFAWYYGFFVIKRGPSYLVASLSLPLTLLFMVGILSHGNLISFALIGGLVSIIASNCINGAADAAFFRLQIKIQDLFVATKITPGDYMMGLIMSYLVFSIPGIVLYAILGLYWHVFTIGSVLPIILILIAVTISISNIAFIIAGSMKHIRNVWGITAVLSIVMTVLPPVFYPYTFLPKIALYVLSASPVTPAAVLLQGYVGLEQLNYTTNLMVLILFAETVILTILGRQFIKWRE
ncbi:MAG: ABC transporter permease [Candidatus Thermoplasmatota archaeon]|nr:ABC transporter permease [Candidatus Thermoplasmatota archaeon]